VSTWAFFSDVHGNLTLLDRGLARARELGAQHYAFLGDFLGRGDPDGVIARVREHGEVVIAGNRDLDWALRVSEESRLYVRALPFRAITDHFLVAHGDPKLDRELNVNDLKRGAPKIYDTLQSHCRRVYLFGHTHHARIWIKSDRDIAPQLVEEARMPLSRLRDRDVLIINVGTAGKPFHGKGPASFTLLNEAADGYVEHVLID
jgi:predicted phosphodiesterase